MCGGWGASRPPTISPVFMVPPATARLPPRMSGRDVRSPLSYDFSDAVWPQSNVGPIAKARCYGISHDVLNGPLQLLRVSHQDIVVVALPERPAAAEDLVCLVSRVR